MKLNTLIIIEIGFFTAFWIIALSGMIDEFNTIVFFEPEFTYGLIAMSILTGMLIGGLIERRDQERQKKQVPVAKVE